MDELAVILVRTGWESRWGDATSYLGAHSGVPGVGVDGARWLADRRPVAVGSDTMAFEHIAPGAGHGSLPVHSMLLVQSGIYIIENLALADLAGWGVREFEFVCTPLPLVGATGSPVRPIALLGSHS